MLPDAIPCTVQMRQHQRSCQTAAARLCPLLCLHDAVPQHTPTGAWTGMAACACGMLWQDSPTSGHQDGREHLSPAPQKR
eukprot:352135-Chlamydomonas_euryale.AAC.7